jgi:hypothetical protein
VYTLTGVTSLITLGGKGEEEGEGAKSTMGIRKFNFRSSQVRKRGKIGLK